VLDILIRGGLVVDGTGSEPFAADVAVDDGMITDVGSLPRAQARRVIDAKGLVVCPGLIDPHSHSDWSILGNPTAQSTIRQGVTTEVVGNCGVTYAPLGPASAAVAASALAALGYEGPVDWRGFTGLLERVAEIRTSQNLAWFVGHSALRDAVGAGSGVASQDQLKSMAGLLTEALDAGALGMSSGLEYGAGRGADTAELAGLARVVGTHDGMYASHIRNRDANLAAAVKEFFDVARTGGVRAQLSHLNVRHNTGSTPNAWQDAVEQLDRCRQDGIDVLADMTPYCDGLGMATGLLPDWLLEGGPASAARMLADPVVRDRLRRDCDRYWRFVHRGQWDRVMLHSSPDTPELEGLSFPDIARRLGKEEWDAFFDVLAAAGEGMQNVQLMATLFTEEHVAEAVKHPLFCLGVDAFTSKTDGPLAVRSRHPLFFAGHIHYLAYHVRDKGTLSLPVAIHKMTAMVADHFGLSGRGRVRPGHHADLAVFDLPALTERATRTQPLAYAGGVPYVVVNGVIVVDASEHTGQRPGTFISRS
jgi:N-acyl-D-aspartate/D-glutamate deacylase